MSCTLTLSQAAARVLTDTIEAHTIVDCRCPSALVASCTRPRHTRLTVLCLATEMMHACVCMARHITQSVSSPVRLACFCT